MHNLTPTQSRSSHNGILSPKFVPEEHVTDILSLLPVKSLLRFRLEHESGLYFDMEHFEDMILKGKWDEAEKYLSGFIKVDDNDH
ncbi:hypothetical protein MTR_7g056753 [Medicago truncatula]|uniref:CTLH domain-containing protein n=1 Tax=Medicago truncatula TaxID=3880 RepID=A0A072TZZ7_MEDTR|nr:hypothetical protein MTR_7g056753 [Medicago truncatula]